MKNYGLTEQTTINTDNDKHIQTTNVSDLRYDYITH